MCPSHEGLTVSWGGEGNINTRDIILAQPKMRVTEALRGDTVGGGEGQRAQHPQMESQFCHLKT